MPHWQPGTIFLAAVDALLDEVHPFDAVVNIGINGVRFLEWLSFSPEDHAVIRRAIDIGERFEKRLGMSARKPRRGTTRVISERRVRIASVKCVRMAIAAE